MADAAKYFGGVNGIVLPSSSIPDPYVPVDGTMNVTGAITTTGNINPDAITASHAGGGASSFGGTGGATVGHVSQVMNLVYKYAVGSVGVGATSINNLLLWGGASSSPTAYGVQIAASADLTDAGAKIATFGDNATVSYAEKAYIDLNGGGKFGGPIGTAVSTVKTAAYTATVADSLVRADPNAAAGSFAVRLPPANAMVGQILTVKVVTTHASRVITVIRAGADTINGVTAGQTTTTFTTTANLASATFQSDGVSVWELIASNGTVT